MYFSVNDTELYAFGSDTADISMVRRDIGYDLVPLPSGLPLWGRTHHKVYVSVILLYEMISMLW